MDENPRITDLRKKLEKDPGSRLFAQLAEELRKEGKYDEAVSIARRGLEKSSNYPSARLTLARALLDGGSPRLARPELEQIVKVSPDNILAGRLLGEVLEGLGEVQPAIQQFERALALSPGDKAIAERLARLRGSVAGVVVPKPPPVVAPVLLELPTVAVRAESIPVSSSAVALDRDLASGTFSPGVLHAADLKKHFDLQKQFDIQALLPSPSSGMAAIASAPSAAPAVEIAAAEAPAPELPDFDELPQTLTEMPFPLELAETMPPGRATPAELADDGATWPEVAPPLEDAGNQTLPLSSVTLADLYLQQGLTAEASAVLSQVIKDEPENLQARSKFAAVSDALAHPSAVEPISPEEPPIGSPKPARTPAQYEQAGLLLKVASSQLTQKEIRARILVSLKAFHNAVEREAVQQRATEFSIR